MQPLGGVGDGQGRTGLGWMEWQRVGHPAEHVPARLFCVKKNVVGHRWQVTQMLGLEQAHHGAAVRARHLQQALPFLADRCRTSLGVEKDLAPCCGQALGLCDALGNAGGRGIAVEEVEAALLAQGAHGSMRDALSLLDRLLSEGEKTITVAADTAITAAEPSDSRTSFSGRPCGSSEG